MLKMQAYTENLLEKGVWSKHANDWVLQVTTMDRRTNKETPIQANRTSIFEKKNNKVLKDAYEKDVADIKEQVILCAAIWH